MVRNSILKTIGLCLILVGQSSGAYAFIPPSQFIIKTWVNKHSGGRSFKIKSVVTAIENGKPSAVHFKDVTVYSSESRMARSTAYDDSDRKLFWYEKSPANRSLGGKLLLSSDYHDVTRTLRERGIPIKIEDELAALRTEAERVKAEDESLVRWNGSFAWLIGTSAVSEGSPQIWFEKDSFLPLRMAFSNPSDDQYRDIRFESYRFASEFPYPRVISVAGAKNRAFLSSQLVDIAVNLDGVGSKSNSNGSTDSGFTEAGKSASLAVRDLIRQYYALLR